MDALLAWFLDPAQWSGRDGIPNRLLEHVALSAAAVLTGAAIAVPVGLVIGHTGRFALGVIALGNLGRAVPSYALLVILVPLLGIGFGNAYVALTLLAIPPILTNTYAGLRGVDRDLVDAGRGMGMTERQLLRGVEIPLALPVILAGLRVAAVSVVATATLAALVGWGTLGRFIAAGFGRQDPVQLVAGAILVALLAVATERSFTLLERWSISPGVRASGTAREPGVAELATPAGPARPS